MQGPKKWLVALVALCIVVGVGYAYWWDTQQGSTLPRSSAGHSVADASTSLSTVTLYTLEGQPVALDSYKGTPLLIEFWGSWCHVCRDQLPEMDRISAKKDKNFTVLTVIFPNRFGEKSLEDFKAWFATQPYQNLTVLVDPEGVLIQQFHVRLFPTTLFVDKEFRVRQVIPGPMSEDTIQTYFRKMDE